MLLERRSVGGRITFQIVRGSGTLVYTIQEILVAAHVPICVITSLPHHFFSKTLFKVNAFVYQSQKGYWQWYSRKLHCCPILLEAALCGLRRNGQRFN